MKKNRALLILVIVFAVVMVGAAVLYRQLGEDAAPKQLVAETAATEAASRETAATEPKSQVYQAPDFTVYDLEGNAHQLSDFFGKPIVLNFWASWCGPCKSEMPDFDAACAELDGQVQFLMVNMTDGSRETVDTASAFIEEQGYTFPVYYDTEQSAAYMYGVYSLPTTYFIDREGNLAAQAKGAISVDILQQGIDMIYTAK